MAAPPENPVTVTESGNGPYAQFVTAGRHLMGADEGKTVDRFERTIQLGGEVTDDQRARLLNIAEKCPVSRTLQRPSLVVSALAETSSVVPA